MRHEQHWREMFITDPIWFLCVFRFFFSKKKSINALERPAAPIIDGPLERQGRPFWRHFPLKFGRNEK
jgi:hypothetical protein